MKTSLGFFVFEKRDAAFSMVRFLRSGGMTLVETPFPNQPFDMKGAFSPGTTLHEVVDLSNAKRKELLSYIFAAPDFPIVWVIDLTEAPQIFFAPSVLLSDEVPYSLSPFRIFEDYGAEDVSVMWGRSGPSAFRDENRSRRASDSKRTLVEMEEGNGSRDNRDF